MYKSQYYQHSCIFIAIGIMVFSQTLITIGQQEEKILIPPPLFLDLSIDEIIQQRTSIRDFSDTPISHEELSTILWNAYGTRSDGSHTIPNFDGGYAVVIYVLTNEGVYQYNPLNHSLLFYKEGDFRSIGQYFAPIQIGLCWDTTMNSDENIVGMQLGAMGQNIYFSCIAMNLGTVATAEVPSPLDTIGLPSHHIGKIVMPIGYPSINTKFIKLPLWISPLPKVRDASISFTTTLENWRMNNSFSHETITQQEISQFLWACYGYSYYLDHSGFETHYIERHRTVPSAHGYYPLEIYTVTSEGIYRYIPGLRHNDPFGLPIVTFQWMIRKGDYRQQFTDIDDSIDPTSPLIFIIGLNVEDTIQWDDLSDPSLRWVWTYEVGACLQNVLLDTHAWDFSIDILPINDQDFSSLINPRFNYEPYLLISIG